MNQTIQAAGFEKAGLFRRLIAMFYDALLLLSVLLFATVLAMLLTRGTLHHHNPFFRSYLFMIWFAFFAWFWTHGGQTLGMRAWKLRVQRLDGRPITLWQALLRFLLAISPLALAVFGFFGMLIGFGFYLVSFFWLLVDRDRMTLYDRFSESIVVRLPK